MNDEELHNIIIFLLSLQEHAVPWPKKSFAETAVGSGQSASAGLMFAGKNGEELVKLAVKGMLPKNRLSRKLATKLKVYAGPNHPHSAQKPQPLAIVA